MRFYAMLKSLSISGFNNPSMDAINISSVSPFGKPFFDYFGFVGFSAAYLSRHDSRARPFLSDLARLAALRSCRARDGPHQSPILGKMLAVYRLAAFE